MACQRGAWRRQRNSASASFGHSTANGRTALAACWSTMATAALPLCWNSAWGKSQTEAGQRASRAARARSRPPGRPQPWPRSQGEAPGPKAPAGHVGTARDELEPQDSVARILPLARTAETCRSRSPSIDGRVHDRDLAALAAALRTVLDAHSRRPYVRDRSSAQAASPRDGLEKERQPGWHDGRPLPGCAAHRALAEDAVRADAGAAESCRTPWPRIRVTSRRRGTGTALLPDDLSSRRSVRTSCCVPPAASPRRRGGAAEDRAVQRSDGVMPVPGSRYGTAAPFVLSRAEAPTTEAAQVTSSAPRSAAR